MHTESLSVIPHRPHPGQHIMGDLKLPSIGEMAFLSPPNTPGVTQTRFSSSAGMKLTSLGRSPESICAEVLSKLSDSHGQLPSARQDMNSTSSSHIKLEDVDRARETQQLPPISHIMKEFPPPSPQHQGGWQMPKSPAVFFGGLPTPSLSPTSPSGPGFSFPFPHVEPRIGRSSSVPTIPSNICQLIEAKQGRQTLRSSSLQGRRSCLFTNTEHPHRPRNESRRFEPYGVFERRPSQPSVTTPTSLQQQDFMSSWSVTDSKYESDSDSMTLCGSEGGQPWNGKAPRKSPGSSGKGTRKKRGKGSNTEYTWEERCFIIYHKVDLRLPWDQVEERFNLWFSKPREDSGLNCKYYRLNTRIPELTEDGQLILGPFPDAEPKDKEWILEAKARRDLERDYEKTKNPEIARALNRTTWTVYDGVKYKAKTVQCRDGEVTLLERFPDHCHYAWVLPEHRERAREPAARREAQKQAWLRVHDPTSQYLKRSA